MKEVGFLQPYASPGATRLSECECVQHFLEPISTFMNALRVLQKA